MSSELQIRVEGASWLAGSETAWSGVLERSAANALFMGWHWQAIWWRHFGAALSGELMIAVACTSAGDVVGIAPLVRRRSTNRRLGSVVQIFPLGNVWRIGVGEVTEHIDFIVAREYEVAFTAALTRYLTNDVSWNEFLCAYTDRNSLLHQTLIEVSRTTGAMSRGDAPLNRYSISTERPFDEFVATLNAATRRKLFGRRALLSTLGTVSREFATPATVASQLQKLETLSVLRWKTGIGERMLGFYRDICDSYLELGALQFSTLEVNGRAISAQLDVVMRGTAYNLRSAIDTNFDPRLSPGLLHIGYNVEAACADPAVRNYDLLAGEGKATDFKKRIATQTNSFASTQLVRRAHEKILYRAYDVVHAVLAGKRRRPHLSDIHE